MPTAKNGIQILNLHPKKIRLKNTLFLMYFYWNFTPNQIQPKLVK